MAQPSESSQSRPSPEHLDSSSVELHAPPGTTQQKQHQHSPHYNHHDEQEQQRLHHHQQHLAPQRGGSPQPPYAASARTSESCTHPVGNSARHVSGGDEGDISDGGSAVANTYTHTSSRAPNTGSEEWLEGEQHTSRKETRYDGDTPLLASPPMSNAQQPQGPRQQMGYPSPTSYPPAGMPPTAHYAYPPQPAPPPDPYRQAPTALPSMRTLEHVPSQQQQHAQQQQQQQHAMMNAHMGAPMAPAPPMGYYSVPSHAYGIHADPNAMRFAMAPGMADPRIALSGGRHKKEIKRRTKTGCLTCRKRRIKCDEAHPTCNNCKKSKRECLGYDPIFKQQQGPTAIQPAPNSQPAPVATLASTPTLPSSTAQSTYHAQLPIVPSSYPPSVPSSITFDSPVSSTSQSVKAETNFDYSAAIDPALQSGDLQGGDLSGSADTPTSQYQQLRVEGADEEPGVSLDSKGGIPTLLSTSLTPLEEKPPPLS
ncbi:hypothetical protein B0T14DRAFT_497353 [Immersiella caudata]|uniref:Zn(2)-C6 fungal-type domain-containing protein n=1 Tax=Immersiella caudata TaxID=314043 RepID=A0AA39WSS9_9PEZI|nr:hypothetical protein B0T14DRAFT_497353 [Immersiella caudata]